MFDSCKFFGSLPDLIFDTTEYVVFVVEYIFLGLDYLVGKVLEPCVGEFSMLFALFPYLLSGWWISILHALWLSCKHILYTQDLVKELELLFCNFFVGIIYMEIVEL